MTKPSIEFAWSVNLGQLLTMMTILIAGVVFAVRLEGRINLNESEIAHLKENADKLERRTADDLRDIKQAIEAIKGYFSPPPSRNSY